MITGLPGWPTDGVVGRGSGMEGGGKISAGEWLIETFFVDFSVRANSYNLVSSSSYSRYCYTNKPTMIDS